MKPCLLLLAALAVTVSTLLAQNPPRAASAPAVKSDIAGMEKAIADLKTEAADYFKLQAHEFFKRKNGTPTPSAALSGVSYTADNLQGLTKLLQTKMGPDNVDTYVQYQLILPMKKLDAETLRRARPVLQQMLIKRCVYRDLPVWPKEKLAVLSLSTGSKGLEQLKDVERRQKAVEEKNDEEVNVVKFNLTSWAMEKALKDLLVAMNDGGADDAILSKLAAEEQESLANFQLTLGVIKDHASEIKDARARKYHQKLTDLAKIAAPRKAYKEQASPVYNQNGNSSWQIQQHYPRIELLVVANMLAPAAGQKDITLPDPKDLNAEADAAAKAQKH